MDTTVCGVMFAAFDNIGLMPLRNVMVIVPETSGRYYGKVKQLSRGQFYDWFEGGNYVHAADVLLALGG